MEYTIIADSCCDLTPQLKERLQAVTVPLTMQVGGREYTDDENLSMADFMAELKKSTEKTGSAAPSPLLFEKAMEKAENSFVITLSSQLSGTYANAELGKTMALEKKPVTAHVLDSKSASAGEVLIAVKIRQLLEKGLPVEQVLGSIHRFIDSMKTYFVLENYDTLQKNGRLNKIVGKLISVLGIKLIMGSDGHGNVALHGKARGTGNMIDKLLAFITNSGRETKGESMVISHCNNLPLALRLQEAINSLFHFEEIFIVPTRGLSSLYADEGGIILAF